MIRNLAGAEMINLTRRTILKGLSTTAASACLAGGCGLKRKAPNFLFFLTDDQRWDTLGATGNPVANTPNIDSLARAGTVFERAYVTTSICPTSRTSILTGQYARRHGIVDFSRPISNDLFAQSYPAILKRAGYFVGFIGKYGVGPAYPDNKFDFIRAFNGQGHYEQPGGDTLRN